MEKKHRFIYRITHYKNLSFILKNGLHCSNSNIVDPDFVPIGFKTLIKTRSKRVVPIEPFGTLSDYIPFYFSTKSPMLFVITKGNDPEVIRTNDEEIIYLVSCTELLEKLQIKFIFTDRHATLAYANFYNNLADLDKLRWDIILSEKWGRQYGQERIEFKQAECLIYKHLPAEGILMIACKTKKMYNNIVDLVKEYKIELKIEPDWYYQ